eukprot:TRINITY_DN57877_c0_g1_i1.p1 TRINITY_DN57877_c0_g1~~TRINITY_DN57877_c0_g1_i1.p1  ORF type:complete len:740 (-),score=106.69 TRINITY_DN57877_c0_g1_i1:422-2641(-)
MALRMTALDAVMLLHGFHQIYASVTLAAERTVQQRTAAILEDARFPSERSEVCMLQHGSALAVSGRAAIPATLSGSRTDLLRRPGLLSSHSVWEALEAGGRHSHASGARGHNERNGDGGTSSEDLGATSQRHSPIDSPAYPMDAEESLTASFTKLQDSIRMHSSRGLQRFHDEDHNITTRGVSISVKDDIDRPSIISSRVHSSPHSMDAERASTASLARKDNIHLPQTSRSEAPSNRTAPSDTEAVSLRSWKLPWVNGSIHSIGPEGHVRVNATSLRGGMKISPDLPASLQRSSRAHAEIGRSPMHLVDAEAALTPTFNALQESMKTHLPTLLGTSPNRSSGATRAPAWTSNAEGALTAKFDSLPDHFMMYHPSSLPPSPSRQSIDRPLFGKHIGEAIRGAALVNGSVPSVDAESALKASFVALQNSIKVQRSLKWEHLDLQRKAKAAEWQAAQTKATDERLIQQDMLIRQEDMRLRQQDEELRRENNQLQRFVSQLTKADSEGRQTHQGSAWADGAPEMSLLLSALLESQAGPAEVVENSSQSTISNKSREAIIELSGSSTAGGRDAQTVKVMVLVAGALGLFIAWIIFHTASFFFFFNAKDENGDGAINFADFEEHMASRVCCGLGVSTARGVLCVVIVAAVGFVFLWWQGIIQPFLRELVCYVYLGVVLLLLVGVFLADLWTTLHDAFMTQIHALQRLMHFFRIDTVGINFSKHVEKARKEIKAVAEDPRSNYSCC